MTLKANLEALATRSGGEDKALRTLINGNVSSLSALNTTAKSNLVAAINELVAAIGGAGASIDDNTISTLTVWSSDKTDSEIADAIAALVDSSPGTLDTLNELAAALGDDPNFATTITNALAAKAPLASPIFTGTVTVPDGSFTIGKTTGLQTALDGKIAAFADPNADRIVFWDDSASAFAALSLSGLTISGTTISPDGATETAQGIAERATLAEVATGTDTTRYVTPQGVAQEIATRAATSHTHTASQVTDFSTAADARVNALVPTATDSVQGKVELATNAEVQAGSDTSRAVTSAGLASRTATDTRTGIAELATNAEVATGSDTARIVTPAGLRSVMGDPETDLVAVFEAALV